MVLPPFQQVVRLELHVLPVVGQELLQGLLVLQEEVDLALLAVRTVLAVLLQELVLEQEQGLGQGQELVLGLELGPVLEVEVG